MFEELQFRPMKLIYWLLFLLVLVIGHHYKTLTPNHDIPPGTVLQESDFGQMGECWSFEAWDVATDPSRVIGHRALKPLYAGSRFLNSDISRAPATHTP